MKNPSLSKQRRAPAWMMVALVCGPLAASSLAGTVVIIEGTDATRNATVRRIADAAEANYRAQGYGISRLSNQNGAVGLQAAVNAINANGVNAVFFMGHGLEDRRGNFTPGLVLDHSNVTSLTPGALTGNYNGIRHVEIQACGQNLQGWRDTFPNANVDAWTRSVTTDQIVNDVRFGSPNRIPRKNPPPVVPPPVPNKVGMDYRFENQIRGSAAYISATTPDAYLDDWTGLGFELSPSTLAQVGTSPIRFNIQTTNGTDTLQLRGLTIASGRVVNDQPIGYSLPDFTLTLDTNAFDAIMGNIDLAPSALGSTAFISGNQTSLTDALCYEAAAAVYFGSNAVPTPGALALLMGGGLLVSRRRAARVARVA